mmetsp:Transcript_22904/g.41377  ORF Transcript_22904/g.41377 Transcript_22904/m.41377 type:complete len:352 (-) Transcript_22904:297-1352(-)
MTCRQSSGACRSSKVEDLASTVVCRLVDIADPSDLHLHVDLMDVLEEEGHGYISLFGCQVGRILWLLHLQHCRRELSATASLLESHFVALLFHSLAVKIEDFLVAVHKHALPEISSGHVNVEERQVQPWHVYSLTLTINEFDHVLGVAARQLVDSAHLFTAAEGGGSTNISVFPGVARLIATARNDLDSHVHLHPVQIQDILVVDVLGLAEVGSLASQVVVDHMAEVQLLITSNLTASVHNEWLRKLCRIWCCASAISLPNSVVRCIIFLALSFGRDLVCLFVASIRPLVVVEELEDQVIGCHWLACRGIHKLEVQGCLAVPPKEDVSILALLPVVGHALIVLIAFVCSDE